ncbi:MAG: UDP-N-acetylmuramate dehydrogenase [Rhodospirillaceae bacterium]
MVHPHPFALSGPAVIARLPALRGRLSANAALADQTWFRVGGPAEVLFKPKDLEDLQAFLAGRPADIPITVIGAASNLLVRDGGIPGVVIKLSGRAFGAVEQDEAVPGQITCGAAALDLTVARFAQSWAIGGLEFLSGIPGTIGGAVRMNAGAYGGEIKDVLVSATIIKGSGDTATLPLKDLNFGYRRSGLAEDDFVVSATLCGQPDADATAIETRIAEIQAGRQDSQPTRARTGGSTFANPDPETSGGRRAWELIDAAGCRGLQIGGAQVSEKHCNFLINTGTATATDLETLGETVRAWVLETSGVALHWEIRRIGQTADSPTASAPQTQETRP